jgi:WD40 repeat protein
VLGGHSTGEVFSADFTADSSVLATGHGDGSLSLWDARSGDHLSRLTRRRAGGGAAYAVAFDPTDLGLAAGYASGGTCIWDPGLGRPFARFGQQDPGEVLAVAFSPDGRTLATSAGQAKLWDIATGGQIPIA